MILNIIALMLSFVACYFSFKSLYLSLISKGGKKDDL